jgi:diacylglycerol kinase family enzyme
MLKGQAGEICAEIRSFFSKYPEIGYHIHITRWKRDAVGFTRRFVSGAAEIVRVHAVGGMGTLFEIINGVVGLPNVQVSSWPYGLDNSFLYYFGKDRIEFFRSLRNLVFSGVASFDVLRCGNNYSISAGYIGLEAIASLQGDRIIKRLDFLTEWLAKNGGVYLASAIYHGLKKNMQQPYRIEVDGMAMDGDYASILVANQPYYANGLCPAIDAEPDDGFLDIYMAKTAPSLKFLRMAFDYAQGAYRKWPQNIFHFRGKNITISSDDIMSICIDGEMFYDSVIEYEAIPQAVDFVCPGERHGRT